VKDVTGILDLGPGCLNEVVRDTNIRAHAHAIARVNGLGLNWYPGPNRSGIPVVIRSLPSLVFLDSPREFLRPSG
jgi:hypothetical protein